uniref:Ig-like domain-containing protein n=1 Tax=Podarcis muralis TaxID=64176 RepID=A0A670HYL6_PODMU
MIKGRIKNIGGNWSFVLDRYLHASQKLIFVIPPSFLKKVDPSYLLTPGESAHLQCKIKGSPEIQVTWYKNNKEIRESDTQRMSFANNVAVLDITNVKVDDSGSYSCEAANDAGSDSCSTEIVVKGFVWFTPNKYPVVQGWPRDNLRTYDAVLECEVTGTPPFEVTWLKNNNEIRSSKKYTMTDQQSVFALHIMNCDVQDAGEYQCIISNEGGSCSCKRPSHSRMHCGWNTRTSSKMVQRWQTTHAQ